ncbi:MAG: hypothetical protein R3254_00985 [Thiomicrorhabdus sp.]|nr:hypothetical protein [Thiomicrorhabdus sp.]
MKYLIILLSIFLTGCQQFIGVGTHPHADDWGSEYRQGVGIIQIRKEIAPRLHLDYTHISAIQDMRDRPGLNTFSVMVELP